MGADVAGIDKYFNASLYKHGYKSFLVKSKLGSRPGLARTWVVGVATTPQYS